MENTMSRCGKHLRLLTAAAMLTAISGCAQSERAAAPKPGGEQAGAWYQIYFEAGDAHVKDKAGLIIGSVARLAANEHPSRLTVIGRTDRIGTEPANMALSRRRADAVRDALIAAGVPASSIMTAWTGEVRPRDAAKREGDDQADRVVDITVLKSAG
jgi:outer membrane protein OmpA-like peptidoglycan-associated protein